MKLDFVGLVFDENGKPKMLEDKDKLFVIELFSGGRVTTGLVAGATEDEITKRYSRDELLSVKEISGK